MSVSHCNKHGQQVTLYIEYLLLCFPLWVWGLFLTFLSNESILLKSYQNKKRMEKCFGKKWVFRNDSFLIIRCCVRLQGFHSQELIFKYWIVTRQNAVFIKLQYCGYIRLFNFWRLHTTTLRTEWCTAELLMYYTSHVYNNFVICNFENKFTKIKVNYQKISTLNAHIVYLNMSTHLKSVLEQLLSPIRDLYKQGIYRSLVLFFFIL